VSFLFLRQRSCDARGVDRAVCDPDECGLEDRARRLIGGSKTRGRCRRRLTRQRYVDIVDAEHGRRPLRMPLNRNGSSKFVTILSVGPGVETYVVTPAHVAIHERDNTVSFAGWRSEPNRILRVLKHRSPPQVGAHVARGQALGVPEPLVPSLAGLGARASARSQMRPTKRLTALVSKLSTVRMIDELSLQPSA
jgi:hypothetical protein